MANKGFKAFDSDIHISEPNFWEQYIEPRFKPQAPKLIPDEDIHQRSENPGPWAAGWKLEVAGRVMGRGSNRSAATEAAMAKVVEKTIDRVRPAVERSFDATSQLEAMNLEGLDRAAVFPTHGLRLADTDTLDPQLAAAIACAYNNWLYDFCNADRERLIGVAMVTPLDIDAAVKETRRAVLELGFRGIFLRPNPVKARNWYDSYYDPLWAELESLDVPVGFHSAATTTELPSIGQRFPEYYWLNHTVAHPGEMMLAMTAIIGGGVLDRFPQLRVSFLEGNASWLPFLLWRMDRGWEWIGKMEAPQLKKKPSDYFKEGRCFVSVESEEDLVKETILRVGDDCLVFSTDYPHLDSEYPHAVDTFLTLPISDESKRKILWDNCARLYGSH